MVINWVKNSWTWLNNVVVRIENRWKWLKMFVVWTRSQKNCQGTKRSWSSQSTFLVWLRCIQKKRWDKKMRNRLNQPENLFDLSQKKQELSYWNKNVTKSEWDLWKVNFIRTSTSASSPFLLFFASHHPHHPQVKMKYFSSKIFLKYFLSSLLPTIHIILRWR